MKSLILLTCVAITGSSTAPQAFADTFPQDMRIGKGVYAEQVDALSLRSFELAGPEVALSRTWNVLHEVTTFHTPQMTRNGVRESRVWFARRVSIDPDNFPATKTQYADGRTCPAIDDVLIMVEQIEKPRIDLRHVPSSNLQDGNRQRAYENIYTDDRYYALSVAAYFDASLSPSKLTIGGGSNTPIAALIELALLSLEPCWSDTMPDLTADPH